MNCLSQDGIHQRTCTLLVKHLLNRTYDSAASKARDFVLPACRVVYVTCQFGMVQVGNVLLGQLLGKVGNLYIFASSPISHIQRSSYGMVPAIKRATLPAKLQGYG